MALGYAQSTHTICELFDRVVVASGNQALYKGAGAADKNLASDLYYRWLRSKVDGWLGEGPGSPNAPSQEARELTAGWVAGVNKYLAEVGGTSGIPDARCKGNPWIKPLTMQDAWMFQATVWDAAGAQTNAEGILAAVPPIGVPSQSCSSAPAAGERREKAAADSPTYRAMAPTQTELPPGKDIRRERAKSGGMGSNAIAIGKLGTKSGSGLLLSNPHWYWDGANRFYRAHITIPGKVNVTGATFVNAPWIQNGHNEHVAWTATVSTAQRTGYWGLTLDASDPTKYLYEGKYEPMKVTCVTAQVRQANGSIEDVRRAFYSSRWGPVLRTTDFPWTASKAYSTRDAGEGIRMVDEFLAKAKARNVGELADALNKYAAQIVQTSAADSGGRTWFGDIGGVPNVSATQVSGVSGSGAAACLDPDIGPALWVYGVPAFDGSRAACAWRNDPGAVPGLAGLASAPNIFREDYVTNSNDSYWLTNPTSPTEGYLKIFGDERTQRSLRTRMGLKMVADRLAGTDGLGAPKFDLHSMKSVMLSNQVLSAELARDAVVAACAAANFVHKGVDLRHACETLAAWDARYNLASKGAAIWRRFVAHGGVVFSVPFDPDQAAATPNTLDSASPAVLDALAAAVTDLQNANIALDAKLETIQGITRQGERIPMHGGAEEDGTFNVAPDLGPLMKDIGWVQSVTGWGYSFVMAVEFLPSGPKSDAVLVYSQSSNPASPNYADQTKLFSASGWDRNHFTAAEVAAATLAKQELTARVPN